MHHPQWHLKNQCPWSGVIRKPRACRDGWRCWWWGVTPTIRLIKCFCCRLRVTVRADHGWNVFWRVCVCVCVFGPMWWGTVGPSRRWMRWADPPTPPTPPTGLGSVSGVNSAYGEDIIKLNSETDFIKIFSNRPRCRWNKKKLWCRILADYCHLEPKNIFLCQSQLSNHNH